MSGGIDDGYSDGVTVFDGYDPGQDDKSAFIIIGGDTLGDVVHMGAGGHAVAAQMMAVAEAAMMEMEMPYYLLHQDYPRTLFPREKRKTQSPCQLPGCQNTTDHRGGYCCAEHCREHRRMQGKRVKAMGR